MIYLTALAGWLFVAWRWGDWRNWKRYHPTILYLCFCDLLYFFLTCDYPLWRLQPKGFISNHSVPFLIEMAIFACTVLVYLGRFPTGWTKSALWIGLWALWIGLWVVVYGVLEWVLLRLGVFTYHHGWTFWDSVLIDILAFPMHPLVSIGTIHTDYSWTVAPSAAPELNTNVSIPRYGH